MEQKIQYFESERRINVCLLAMTMPVPTFSCFCESEIIHVPVVAFLGCVFSRKSHPFMCMCRHAMHVIKPMQITAFTYARTINTDFGKGK